MKFLFNRQTILFFFLLLLSNRALYGQSDLGFSYHYNRGGRFRSDGSFNSPVFSEIKIKSPHGNVYQLFADTVNEYEYSQRNFFKEQGEYVLMIYFSSDKYGRDSMDYTFETSGKEIKIDLSISFIYREKEVKNGEYWVKKEKIPQGYVSVFKYVAAPESIEISLNQEKESNEYYKGPFFYLKNNSNDTIYGVHLPGYFWGKLYFIKNDSIVYKSAGTIDDMFENSPPLYPGSTRIAMVGSFGLFKQLPPFKYSYELLLSKKWESLGIGVFLEKENFVWWAGTKEFYQLTYNFEVK